MANTVAQHFLRYGMPQYPMTKNPHEDEASSILMKPLHKSDSITSVDTRRRSSIFTSRQSQYIRRKSSVKLNEHYSKELHEANMKMISLTKTLRATEDKYSKLLHDYEKITKLYSEAKDSAITTVWGYALEESTQFTCIPHMDIDLAECEHRIGPYKVESIIGKGQFSIVKVCTKGCTPPDHYIDCIPFIKGESTKKPFATKSAVKIIPKSEAYTVKAALRIEHEIKTLRKLCPHKNIIEYRDCLHGKENLYIFTECYPMDLFDFIERYKGVINENIVGVITREILNAIEHMRAYNIVHRDIKPENVLIAVDNSTVSTKLCDFGLAVCLPDKNSRLTDFCGSPGFFAPEILLTDSYCPHKAEIFSVGCVVLELLVSDLFFKDQWLYPYTFIKTPKAPDFSRAIRQAIVTAQVEIQKKHSQNLSDCYVSMTNTLPNSRAESKELLKNHWISKANSLHAADVLNGKEPRKLISLHIPEINSISPQNLKRISDMRITPKKNTGVYDKEFLKSMKQAPLSPLSTERTVDTSTPSTSQSTTPFSSVPSTSRVADSVPSTGRILESAPPTGRILESAPSTGRILESTPSTGRSSDETDEEYSVDYRNSIPLKPSQLFKMKNKE